jgi:Pyridoxamine 5'-phosphate oxidase
MAKIFDAIDARLGAWIARQRMFFVATAPTGDGGHVNVSPKGPIETLRVLDERTIAYLDLVGSGAETIAHLRDNGRIVVMLCSFDGPPRIVRLHGRGEILPASAIDFPGATALPEQHRTVIRIDVERIADSCGFGVPLMSYEGERPQSRAWAETKLAKEGPAALEDYVAQKNAVSIDGLPALG